MSGGLQPNAPGVALPRRFMGLPTSGAMGNEPAVSVAGIMGVISIIFGIVVQLTGWQLPPDVQAFFDQWGTALVGIAIGAYTLITGYFIRQRVVAPVTAAEKVVDAKVVATP